jgi:hypothetical protein
MIQLGPINHGKKPVVDGIGPCKQALNVLAQMMVDLVLKTFETFVLFVYFFINQSKITN